MKAEPRIRFTTSIILIAAGGKKRWFGGIQEIPPKLRKRLLRAFESEFSARVLIADKTGQKEIGVEPRDKFGVGVSIPRSLLAEFAACAAAFLALLWFAFTR